MQYFSLASLVGSRVQFLTFIKIMRTLLHTISRYICTCIPYSTTQKSQLVHCSKEMLQIQRLVPTRRRNKRTKKRLINLENGLSHLYHYHPTNIRRKTKSHNSVLPQWAADNPGPTHACISCKVAIAKKVGSLISRRFSLLLATINSDHQKSSSSQRLFSLDYSSAPPSLLLSSQHGIQYL